MNGNVLLELPSPARGWSYGLAWDGDALWLAGYSENKLYKIDRIGTVLEKLDAPSTRPEGLEFDGEFLWVSCFGYREADGNACVYKLDRTGKLVAKYLNEKDVNDFAWDGSFFWASAYTELHDRIYKIDPENFRIVGWISASGVATHDLAWVNGSLWATDWTNEALLEPKVFELKPIALQAPAASRRG